jgi:hypothetical protein
MSTIRRALSIAVLLTAAAGVLVTRPAAAQSVPPSPPPANLDTAHPTVSGILVAKPVSGEGNIPQACRDRDVASVNAAVQERRGLVICTAEGKLVLLVVDESTGYYARYWGKYSLNRLTDGDHVRAWGVLRDYGYELNPTYAVQDTDIQEAYVDSQDFIMHGGPRLTLGVLSSDPKGPVQGIVHAVQGGYTEITLCNGHEGTWADLTTGKTIDITNSLFNRRLKLYIHTARVKVVSCP